MAYKQIPIPTLKLIRRRPPSFLQKSKRSVAHFYSQGTSQVNSESSRRPPPPFNLPLRLPPCLLFRPMDVQFSAGSLVWRIRWRTEAKWSDRSTYLGCPRLSRSRILLEADICAAIEQEGAARVGDGRQRESQPCWCQSQRNHSEVWRAAGAAERVRRAGRRCCFLIRRGKKKSRISDCRAAAGMKMHLIVQ